MKKWGERRIKAGETSEWKGGRVGGSAKGASYLQKIHSRGISGRDESDKVEKRREGGGRREEIWKSERKEEVKRESGHSFIPLETDAG